MGKRFETCPSCRKKGLYKPKGYPYWGDGTGAASIATSSERLRKPNLGDRTMTQEMAKTFFESQGWEVSDLKPLPKGATWTTARSAVSPQGAELRFRGLDDDIVEVWTDCSGNIYKVKTQERLRDIMWGHG